jgi:ribosomal protein S18 acetylase RimI-like enzyme
MVTQGLDVLRKKGVSTAILFVEQSNAGAVALYESLGFKVERDDRLLHFHRN